MGFALSVVQRTCSFSKGTPGHLIFQKIIRQLNNKVQLGSLFEAIKLKAEAYTARCEYCKAGRAFSNFADACADPKQAVLAWNEAIRHYDMALPMLGAEKHLARLKIYSGMLRARMALATYYSAPEYRQTDISSLSLGTISELVLKVQKEAGSVTDAKKSKRYCLRVTAESLFLEAVAAKFFAEHYFAAGKYSEATKSAQHAYEFAGRASARFTNFRFSSWDAVNKFHFLDTKHSQKMERELGVISAECSQLQGVCQAALGEHGSAALQYRIAGEEFAFLGLEKEHAAVKALHDSEVEKVKNGHPTYSPHPFPEFQKKSTGDAFQKFMFGSH